MPKPTQQISVTIWNNNQISDLLVLFCSEAFVLPPKQTGMRKVSSGHVRYLMDLSSLQASTTHRDLQSHGSILEIFNIVYPLYMMPTSSVEHYTKRVKFSFKKALCKKLLHFRLQTERKLAHWHKEVADRQANPYTWVALSNLVENYPERSGI